MAQQPSTPAAKQTAFGPNEWLVDELYLQYLDDRNSVDPAWWEFFVDYQPSDAVNGAIAARNAATAPGGHAGATDASDAVPGPGTVAPGHRVASSSAVHPTASAATAASAPSLPAQGTPASSAPAPSTPAPGAPASAPAARTAAPAPGRPAPNGSAGTAATAPAAGAVRPQPGASAGAGQRIGREHPVPGARRGDGAGAPRVVRLKGTAARVVANMESSLEIPTATSVRAVPAKLLVDNRIVVNNFLVRARGGKVSFTHLIGFAVVEALRQLPEMNNGYTEDDDGKPAMLVHERVNLGIAIDLSKPDGTRQLLVPAVRNADGMDFATFWASYEDVIRRARNGKLTADDFVGTTITLTNPGTIGTNHSVPRLMRGQGAIIGVGAMDYPAEYQGASEETLARLAVSKILTLTSTYDHRIIQGAQSGDFLRVVHGKLLGEDGFYDRVFRSLRIPYEPVRWVRDISVSHDDEINKTARVVELIHAYRVRGHLMADTDPLEYRQRRHPDLDIQTHGLTMWDLEREFPTGGFGGKPMMKLRHILGVLRDSYCRTIGIEYMHIQDPEQRDWIHQRVETRYAKPTREEQLRILRRLNGAEAFETFLQTKYVGQKRFSLEGGESLIALLDALLSAAADAELAEVCVGMAHRGRLNVLANIAGKTYSQIFREFEGTQDPRTVQGSGDVKYHLGTEGRFTAENGKSTKVYLAANPSHLEAVNPVLEGVVRAKQDRINLGGASFPVLPVLLHGDAAFAGQGVVAETLNLSQLRGYRTGGTIHVVINNQVGFTTAPAASRSSFYCTDVGKMIQAPIFHVNGDDPEACVRVAQLAFDFRQAFDKDVVIDLVCYRRRGHNEGDDPSMTQPLMYRLIEAKRSVRKLYTESLIGRGDISVEEAEQALRDYSERLEQVFRETRETVDDEPTDSADAREIGRRGLEKPESQAADEQAADEAPPGTAVDVEVLRHIGDVQASPPDGFTVHPKLRPLLEKRQQMSKEGGIDWAFGELLAFGSLLMEGTPVRLAGQDSRRGTFVQRHAVLTDRTNGQEWTPLRHLTPDQGQFWLYDSLLSEFAAMGFEYGYSVERPDALVLWEAQFGDFANGAQTIIDEFISCSAQKWGQHSSVVLLLPHGYEGQGPDHSSGRIERFLQMYAEENLTVAMPSTPASYFHLLRRQAYARPRRPLVVFTPKSMLRLRAASSAVDDFTTGTFEPVIGDPARSAGELDPNQVDRLLLCAGKVHWDLVAERARRQDTRTAIARVEQLAPVPLEPLRATIATYPNAELYWVQEEPANQGGWPHIAVNTWNQLDHRLLHLVSRPASASPAAGSTKKHQAELVNLLAQSFAR